MRLVSNVACVSSVRPWFLFVMFVLYISSSMRLYVLSSVFWFPLRFRHANNIPFVLPPLVCRRAHVLFMISVFVAYRGVPHYVISYVFTFSVPCCDVRIKRCSVRLCPQFFYMRAHGIFRQELFTLREHLGSFPVFCGVRVTFKFSVLCFLCFVLTILCVLYTQCCQCLWIVHSRLAIRFSLAFICMHLSWRK
jgi:hypothetical protein